MIAPGRSGGGTAAGAALAATVLAATTAVARTREVHQVEHDAFRTVNDLPDAVHRPVYVVMQSGSLAAVFVTAAVVHRTGHVRLARATAVTGSGVWAAAKVVKRWVGRGRPSRHVTAVRVRGKEEGGLGFPSGHTAVACCLALMITPELPAPARPVAWAVAGTVGLARVYVGAHLPLDVVGGAALGVIGGAAGRWWWRAGDPGAPARPAGAARRAGRLGPTRGFAPCGAETARQVAASVRAPVG